jgi:hypothetical protein
VSEPDRSAAIQQIGNEWLAEVAELRAVDVPDVSAQPPDLRKVLVIARGNLDRLEEIYAQAMALSSAAKTRARELTEKADDALDTAIAARGKRARDFEGARERLADASLTVLGPRQAARSAQKVADMAAGVEKRIRLHYYGLSGARDDLINRLRGVAWESNLDR